MKNSVTNIDPKVLALPSHGMIEDTLYADNYQKIGETLLKQIDILKRLQAIDTDNDYDQQIAQTFGKAFLNNMEWEVERRRILAQWHRGERCIGLDISI